MFWGKKYISLRRHDFELKVTTRFGQYFYLVYCILPSNPLYIFKIIIINDTNKTLFKIKVNEHILFMISVVNKLSAKHCFLLYKK